MIKKKTSENLVSPKNDPHDLKRKNKSEIQNQL